MFLFHVNPFAILILSPSDFWIESDGISHIFLITNTQLSSSLVILPEYLTLHTLLCLKYPLPFSPESSHIIFLLEGDRRKVI